MTTQWHGDPDDYQPESKAIRFDYQNQAWVVSGKYLACGHPKPCTDCYGTTHEGQPPAPNADFEGETI